MNLEIAAIGKMKKSPFLEVIKDYETRILGICRPLGYRSFKILEFDTKKSLKGDALKSYEADLLLPKNMTSCALIALDERGESQKSTDFSKLLERLKHDSYQSCRLVIGGADGLDQNVRQSAHHLLSFGQATWPHLMVRLMATEQIYRAMTVLAGHPYHRE